MSYRKKHYPPKPDKPIQQSMFAPEYSNPGVLRSLPTSKLTSGLSYQRPINEREVRRLVRDWDDQLLDPLTVSFRDGRYNVVDDTLNFALTYKIKHFLNGGAFKVLAAPSIVAKLHNLGVCKFRRPLDKRVQKISLVCYTV